MSRPRNRYVRQFPTDAPIPIADDDGPADLDGNVWAIAADNGLCCPRGEDQDGAKEMPQTTQIAQAVADVTASPHPPLGYVELLDRNGSFAAAWYIFDERCAVGSEPDCDIRWEQSPSTRALIVFGRRHAVLKSVRGTLIVGEREVGQWLIDSPTFVELEGRGLMIYPTAAARVRWSSDLAREQLGRGHGPQAAQEAERLAEDDGSVSSATAEHPSPTADLEQLAASIRSQVLSDTTAKIESTFQSLETALNQLNERCQNFERRQETPPPAATPEVDPQLVIDRERLSKLEAHQTQLNDSQQQVAASLGQLQADVARRLEALSEQHAAFQKQQASLEDRFTAAQSQGERSREDQDRQHQKLVAEFAAAQDKLSLRLEAMLSGFTGQQQTAIEKSQAAIAAGIEQRFATHWQQIEERLDHAESSAAELAAALQALERSKVPAEPISRESELPVLKDEGPTAEEASRSAYESDPYERAASQSRDAEIWPQHESDEWEASEEGALQTPEADAWPTHQVSEWAGYEADAWPSYEAEPTPLSRDEHSFEPADELGSHEELPSWFTAADSYARWDEQAQEQPRSDASFYPAKGPQAELQLEPCFDPQESGSSFLSFGPVDEPADLNSVQGSIATAGLLQGKDELVEPSETEDVADEPQQCDVPHSQAVVQEPTENTAVADVEDGLSVEEYMQQLLRRVNGQPPAAVTAKPSTPFKPAMKPVEPVAEAAPSIEPSLHVTSTIAEQTVAPETSILFDDLEPPVEDTEAHMRMEDFIPRAAVPESGIHLAAMRALANETARNAIQTSNKNKPAEKNAPVGKLVVSGVGFATGTVLLLLKGLQPDIFLVGTVSAYAIFLIWGFEAVQIAEAMSRRKA